ncbi:MAG TPA: SCO family protein [Mariprofundaceae bacterium]|nr:SCO family protein [Mariprofundaceae bacterium]
MADMKKGWIAALLALVVAGVAAALLLRPSQPPIPPALQTLGGDFSLQSSAGAVRLSDFHGKAVLVYFGYTHCPDACPMALGVMAEAMRQLDAREQEKVAGIFISLDPRRDTPELLQKYAGFFDPRILGVTGSSTELAKVAADWRVSYEVPDKPADTNYTVSHSTFIYLVNPAGKVVALFDEKTGPGEIAGTIRRWLD